MTDLSLVLSAAAAVAAGGAWWAARRSSDAATAMSVIEAERRRAELTPQFAVTARHNPGGGDQARLAVTLTGPASLDQIDALTVSIRDDADRTTASLGIVPTEQLARQVWGPYRFVPTVDRADESGRTVPPAPAPLLLGDDRQFVLERTPAPPWHTSGDSWWRDTYEGTPVRLTLLCQRGESSWRVPKTVVVTPSAQPGASSQDGG